MKIDLFTFLGPNSTDYAEFLKYTCDKFTSKKHKVNWKCIETEGNNRIPEGYKLVAKSNNVNHDSMNHAEGLNLAQKYIESDYVIFIDADMAILHQNWDDIIINELNKYDCFGAAFPNGLRKYRNFPSVYLFAFRSHILNKVKLDFSPKYNAWQRSVCNYPVGKEEAELFGILPGKKLHTDTGWKIPSTIVNAGFTFNVMDAVYMASENSQLPFENNQQKEMCMECPRHMTEWLYKGKLFTTHKHCSREMPITSGLGKEWKRRIEMYIENKGELI